MNNETPIHPPSAAATQLPPLDVEATFAGKNLIVIGATGFLGKVWISMLLDRYPGIGTIYTVVRAKGTLSPTERFWTEVAPSEAFNPLRRSYQGQAYEDFLREKIVPIDGDVSRIHLGIDPDRVTSLRGSISAIVNVAGVVDFNPPLDEALKVNAFGAQNLVELARTLGDVPVLHTSTCFVVGRRDGITLERNTLEFPFPRADELDVSHWNAEREIEECIDVVEQARRRVEDAPRQSHLLDEAKNNLTARHEPIRGVALTSELESVKRKFVRKKLIEAGKERAQFWGWPNIYTYTKSIGEQVILRSGLRVTIVRPAIVESAMNFPEPGWCEGISTSSPIMYLAYAGQQHIPVGEHCCYDAIPVDMCAAGMIASLAALIDNRHDDVYQYSSADKNPLKTRRAGELIGIAKRRYYRAKTDGNQLVNLLQSYTEPDIVPLSTWKKRSTPVAIQRAKTASRLLSYLHDSPIGNLARSATKQLDSYSRQAGNVNMVFSEFIPFITANEYRFSAANTRKLMAQLCEADQKRLPWSPETIDWRSYWLDVHQPGVEKWSIPLLEEKLRKEKKPQRKHDNLVSMLEDLCERHGNTVAMQRLEGPKGGEQLTRIRYSDMETRSAAVAGRLHAAGFRTGDRIALGGKNHPDWAIVYFGILRIGATAVPLDRDHDATNHLRVLRASGAKLAVLDNSIEAVENHDKPQWAHWNLHETAASASDKELESGLLDFPRPDIAGPQIASIIYTSGSTTDPKGVMLSHENFTAMIAALAPVFPLNHRDRLLSVLPLHETFEFTCGLLLPLSRGARIIYLDEVNGDRMMAGLGKGQITSMVGVPAVWELLEERIRSSVSDRGTVAERIFDSLLEFNRNLGRNIGIDIGRILFSPIHERLGGNLRLMISGSAALPPDLQETFQGLGLHVSEGYGLTEAAPLLTVAKGSAQTRSGHVGRPLPGIEIKIDGANADGIGQIVARGPNIMQGYADSSDSTDPVDPSFTTGGSIKDGWLQTGDMGRLDDKDRLRVLGRSTEVIVLADGERLYPDDLERRIGPTRYISEFSIVGLPNKNGNDRVACLAVPKQEEGEILPRGELHQRALTTLRRRFEDKLPREQRPSVVHLSTAKLPRTSTKRILRKDVQELTSHLQKNAQALRDSGASSAPEVVRVAIASVIGKEPDEISADLKMINDLGFSATMMAELVTTIEAALPSTQTETLSESHTVGDIEKLVQRSTRFSASKGSSRTQSIESDEDNDIVVPQALVEPVKKALSVGQQGFYERIMRVDVKGHANIPQNRNTIVVANHASHIDMGLCKYALGNYGDQLVALAAEDYFFRGKWARTYVRNFTNMAAIDRKSGLRRALRQAGEHLERGRTILIFPEGTRSDDGLMRDFMPLIGNLCLNHDVDILPLYLHGTARAFPKGSKIPVPRHRDVSVRIGTPLRVERLKQHVADKKRSASYRAVAGLAQRAVEALRDGGMLDLDRLEIGAADPLLSTTKVTVGADSNPLAAVFGRLEKRFVSGAVKKPLSFYFSLGEGPESKWSLQLDSGRCRFQPGRPAKGRADCVLKTSTQIFMKIVNESYTPSVAEFMSGKVKSNDIQLLQSFQKAFAL